MQPDGDGEEYLREVAYVRQFSRELSPPLLRAAAALNGFTPPPADDFDYCELGCGTGDTTNTLAAAHPRARFIGVDFNAQHVAFAGSLSARGCLANVRFLERDFANLAAEELPQFDYIAAHGVLSWIVPRLRSDVLDFAAGHLKPGGILFVTYNALPGWAAVEPLRRLMHDTSAGVEGGALERARRGVGIASMLLDAGAEYFASNPAAKEMLGTILKMGLPYAAHEYFAAHWQPMYFADVAKEMAARGLGFIGQVPLYNNYRDLTIPASAMELFKQLTDRISFESLKDFAVNEFFRGDLYVKGSPPRDVAATRAYLDTTPFGTLTPAPYVKRAVRLRHHVMTFEGELFEALIARLALARSTVPELARDASLAVHGEDAIRSAVLRLLLGDQVAPMQVGAPGVAALYNRTILEQRLSTEDPVVLASPVAGTGVVVPTLQAVLLRLITSVEPTERAAWLRAFVARQPVRLKVGEREVVTEEEQARVLSEELEKYRAGRLPKLVELGVVEPLRA
jgi:trans-aconitate methyltransferase